MAKRIYLGASDVARNNRQLYTAEAKIPVARKVRKGYAGIGGKARPFWNRGVLTYYGTVTTPTKGGYNSAGASVAGYAVFAGGEFTAVVNAYDENYTHHTPTGLSNARGRLGGTTIGGYALFAGGCTNGSTCVNTVDAYDKNMTRTTAAALSVAREGPEGKAIGTHALFVGGVKSNTTTYYSTADAYNADLTRTTAASASVPHNSHAAARTKNHALFASGYQAYNNKSKIVDAYNADLTRTTAAETSTIRSHFSGTEAGGYALFAGGYDANTGTSTSTTASVDAYDDNLTKTVAATLSSARQGACGGSLDGYALFVGGYNGSASVTTVDVYDENLSRTTGEPISAAINGLKSATVGDSVFFCEHSVPVTEVFTLM